MRSIARAAARIFALVLFMLASIAATAQTSSQGPQPAPTSTVDTQHQPEKTGRLFGDWGGLHFALAVRGIDVTLGYTSEFAANRSGGTRRDATETGQFSFNTVFDMDKLIGWQGASVHSVDRRGKGTPVAG